MISIKHIHFEFYVQTKRSTMLLESPSIIRGDRVKMIDIKWLMLFFISVGNNLNQR